MFIRYYWKIVINEYIQCVPWSVNLVCDGVQYVTTSCERDYLPIRWLSSIISLKTGSTTSPLPFVFYNQCSVTIYLFALLLCSLVGFFFRNFLMLHFNRLVVGLYLCLLTLLYVCIKTERWMVWSDIPFCCLTFSILETTKTRWYGTQTKLSRPYAHKIVW